MMRTFSSWATVIVLLSVAVAGCAATEIEDDAALGQPPLCAGSARDLGTIVVYPRTAWRPDQKEPELRAAIAARAIEKAFQDLPCGRLATIHPVDSPRDWHEADIRRVSREAGADTVILMQMRELGPHVVISAPALWSGSAEVLVHFRAVDVATGQPLLDIERRRTVGGPYVVKSADDLEGELVTVLRGLIGA